MKKLFRYLLPSSIGILSVYFILWYMSTVAGWISPGFYLDVIRWVGEILLLIYAIKRNNLTIWIFTSMFFGAEIGLYSKFIVAKFKEIGIDFPNIAASGNMLGKIFLRCIKTIIAPLLFATLVVGIAGHSDLKQVGRMGLKALIYFELVTTVALFIGLVVVNITKPGAGFIKPDTINEVVIPVSPKTWQDHIIEIFPENFAKSVADGAILQVVIFSILFGIGLAMVAEVKRRPMISFCESLSEVMFKFTNIVMLFAPFAVGGAIAYTVSTMGMDMFLPLAKLVGSLYLGLLIFVFGVLLPIALIVKVPIVKFAKAISEPVSIAFATASSESALPRAMEEMERIGVPPKIVGFVLPTGYSFNLDGTTLYLSLASIFVAQVAGIELTIWEQVLICLTLMLTSKGVAGVARASMVILAATVSQFNMPMWPVYLIMAVDVLMDMGRTAVNVIGNCLASIVVAKWEGEYNPNMDDEKILEVKEF